MKCLHQETYLVDLAKEFGLGVCFFVVQFNGACLRPSIPRPISKNMSMQVKFIDDASQAASINLKLSLIPGPEERYKPLNYHYHISMVLKLEDNIFQQALN